ncbi:hypothetical protein WG908_04445 [Sphingobium sp. AN641]|uniref:hypothetical protein n=1 Tax=Sphingobium sp. AN641 TaxID=3133443 RepID=UPI0030BC9173
MTTILTVWTPRQSTNGWVDTRREMADIATDQKGRDALGGAAFQSQSVAVKEAAAETISNVAPLERQAATALVTDKSVQNIDAMFEKGATASSDAIFPGAPDAGAAFAQAASGKSPANLASADIKALPTGSVPPVFPQA